MRWLSVSVFLVVNAAVGCGGKNLTPVDPALLSRPKNYIVGVADSLRIHVREHSDATSDVIVQPDGKIILPLIKAITAEGKTAEALAKELGKAFAEYFKNPLVTVSVNDVNSYRFTVSGEATQPGVYTSKRWVTVLEALAMAGGPTRFAETDKIQIVRCCDRSGASFRIGFNYEANLEGKIDQNVWVLNGDVIVIP
jgi:polysaccharide export outer membrane protein